VTVRILVVARGYPSYDIPGRGSFVADHVTALRQAGADVVVASFETVQARGPQAERAAAADAAEALWRTTLSDAAALTRGTRFGAQDVRVARLPVVRTWGVLDGSEVPVMVARHRAPLLAFGQALASAGCGFDVVHAHNGLPDGAAASALASAVGVPLVVTEHDSTVPDRLHDPSAAAAYRELLGSATVVAVGEALADRIHGALGGSDVAAAGLRGVLPNVVPLSRFPAPAADDRRDPDELLWVGARAPHKGFETLLQALAIVRARRPALHLRAIGPSTPDDEQRWQVSIEELGLGDTVSLERAATREGVATAMRGAGLFVHPSPFETFGIVAAEALASGLPVAATPSGGVEGILAGDQDRGEVAEANTPEALAVAIERLRDRLHAIDRVALRASVEERFGPVVIAAKTLALYEAAGVWTAAEASQTVAPGTGSRPVVGAVVVGTHPSAATRVQGLPDGPLPIRLVRPGTRATHTDPRSRGRLDRLMHRDGDEAQAPADSIEGAWRDLGGEAAAGRVVLVPADVEDVRAIARAFDGEGAPHLAPGSLRWLGDVRDASAARVGR
jgi:glycosyltransferase involved in cell wall biosynthesis